MANTIVDALSFLTGLFCGEWVYFGLNKINLECTCTIAYLHNMKGDKKIKAKAANTPRKLKSFRLTKEVIELASEMSPKLQLSESEIVESGIRLVYRKMLHKIK